jgi:hypothetical protein
MGKFCPAGALQGESRVEVRAGEVVSDPSLVRAIEACADADHSGTSGAERPGDEEAILRHKRENPCATEASCLTTLRAVGIFYSDEEGEAVREFLRQQAEIGEPMREIEVTPIEEPVPDFAPAEEPAESPAEPVREPERVPA